MEAELFTGKQPYGNRAPLKKVTVKQVLSNWGWVPLQLCCSILIAVLFLYSGIWKANDCSIGLKALGTASAKTSFVWSEAFSAESYVTGSSAWRYGSPLLQRMLLAKSQELCYLLQLCYYGF